MEQKKLGRPKGSKNKHKGAGGARAGAGRKPKADEQALIERLDNVIDKDEAMQVLSVMAMGGDFKALQLYMQYRYGRPRESKDITLHTEQPLFNLGLDED